jgi:heme exporter protein A
MEPAAELHAVTKLFGATPILRQIDFSLERGNAAILIGGNGAGKSTVIRLLAGLARPTSGVISILGCEGGRLTPDHRRRIGVLTHQSWLYPNLTARENLLFHMHLRGVNSDAPQLAEIWLKKVGLHNSANTRVREFSRGMEQRLASARAFLSGTELLLLDEPFASLDSGGIQIVRDILRTAVEAGAALLVTAHNVIDVGVDAATYELSRGRLKPLASAGSGPTLKSVQTA